MLGLERALQEANDKAPHLAGLAHQILRNMPRRPLASQNIRAITRNPATGPLPIHDAITVPWICFNSNRRLNALVVDIDHADGTERVAALPPGCPRPTLSIDPHSGRAHAILFLATPVLTGKGARPGPQNLAKRASLLLAAALRGTPMPAKSMVKSPWGLAGNLIGARMRRSPTPATPAVWQAYEEYTAREAAKAKTTSRALMWITQPGDGPAELKAILATLEDEYGDSIQPQRQEKGWRKDRSEPSVIGRNCALFDLTRWWAYDNFEKDEAAIHAEADRINAGLPNSLPPNEVASIARSICRFMNSRFQPRYGASRRRRDCDLNRGMDARSRLAFAGRRTAEGRAISTDAKIATARAQLAAEGKRPTQVAIAALAGISDRTIRRRRAATCNRTDAIPIRYSGLPDTTPPASEPTNHPPSEPYGATATAIEATAMLSDAPMGPIEARLLPIIAIRKRSLRRRRANSWAENRRPAESTDTGTPAQRPNSRLARSETALQELEGPGTRPGASMERSANDGAKDSRSTS